MPNEMNPNDPHLSDPRNLWQNQEVVRVTITLDDVRHKASRFERRIHWRNVREYVAGGSAVVFFSVQLLRHQWHFAPALLLGIAGTLYAMLQIYRRGRARLVPGDAGIMATLEFHRLELERQRDALSTVWRWYILPFVPAPLAVIAIIISDRGIHAPLIGLVAFFVLVFVGGWKLNERAARLLNRKIQEVKAMEASRE